MDAYDTFLTGEAPLYTTEQLEEAMQRAMDSYAGGIGSYYRFNGKQLAKAKARIEELIGMAEQLKAENLHEFAVYLRAQRALGSMFNLDCSLGGPQGNALAQFCGKPGLS